MATTPAILPGRGFASRLPRSFHTHARLAWHLLLLAVTLCSTTVVGMRYMANFRAGLAPIASDVDILPYGWAFLHRTELTDGLPFSLTLLAILLAHEFGHFMAARAFGVSASLPFVIPAPSLSGTAGAVIRLHTRVSSRIALLSIGAMGPIAGFAVAAPAVIAGVLLSRPIPPDPNRLVDFHLPLLVRSAAHWLRPGIAGTGMAWHPVLVAAWIGILITALNLVPAGQFDGGHIVYACAPRAHRAITWATAVTLLVLGITCWVGWLLWAALLVLPGMRHPQIDDTAPLDRRRLLLAGACLAIFILCALPQPFGDTSLIDMLGKLHRHFA